MPFDFTWSNIEVYAEPGTVRVGTARPRGYAPYRGGMATIFGLSVEGASLPGLWICDGRRFVPLLDALGREDCLRPDYLES